MKIQPKTNMYTKIIHLIRIKIYLLLLIFCCGAFSENVDTSKVMQPSLNAYPEKVAFRRIQSYRSFILSASGIADFNSNKEVVVTYRRPFKYSVSYSDTATIALSKDRKVHTDCGFKDVVVSDPFQALMILCTAARQSTQYMGAFDSVWIYEGDLCRKKCRFSIDRTTQLVQEIALLNVSGAVYEQMHFYYKKDLRMPSSIVVFKSTGGELVKDSLVLF